MSYEGEVAVNRELTPGWMIESIRSAAIVQSIDCSAKVYILNVNCLERRTIYGFGSLIHLEEVLGNDMNIAVSTIAK